MKIDVVPLYYLMKGSHLDEYKNFFESNRDWMYMDEFVNYMILRVFIEFFGVKIVIGLSKNLYDLILTIGFDLNQNNRYISDIY